MGVAPRLEIVTRTRCHLCEEMEAVLDTVLPQLGMGYSKLDVDADPVLKERFGDTVPVLLRDGSPVAKVRLDAEHLMRIVRRRRA